MEATEQPILAVSLGVGAPEKVSDRENFARNLLGGMGELKDARLVSRDLIKLGTMQTHEIQAEGKDAKSGGAHAARPVGQVRARRLYPAGRHLHRGALARSVSPLPRRARRHKAALTTSRPCRRACR